MKHLFKIYFLISAGLSVAISGRGQFVAVAVSSNPGAGLHVAVNWWPIPNAVKYNIYRKSDGDAGYPSTPLNTTPIQPAGTCGAITALLTTPDSSAWKMVAFGLADSVLFNPCLMNSLPKPSEKYERLLMITSTMMPVSIAAGLGYKDNALVLNRGYDYKIVGLNASNAPVGTVATDLHVVAGVFTLIPPPKVVIAAPGDAAVQIRWTRITNAAGYVLERSTHPQVNFQRVNTSVYATTLHNKLNGDTLIPSAVGMLDLQRYDTLSGKAIPHGVNGVLIAGPKNGIPYYYRVRSIDLFKRAGNPSTITNFAMPVDSTTPSVPLDIVTTSDDTTGHVHIKWTQVVRDIHGHWEAPDSSVRYRLYRFASSDNPDAIPSVFIGTVHAVKGIRTKDTTDRDPALRSPHGNRTWWYRVRAVDASGNSSQWSSAVSAIVKDTTKPNLVHQVTATGFEDHISIQWQPNSDPDIASYMIYRSLCHLGSWVECNPLDTCKQWIDYDPQGKGNSTPHRDERPNKLPCPCSGPFVFLGAITHDSAKRAVNAGRNFWEDRSIPAGSPLCYAYWIKAKDSSDNTSGSFPLPAPAERPEIFCQRLRDHTGPEPAIISGLYAQADQVRIAWIGPPSQDTRAYHVYRGKGTQPGIKPAVSEFEWVGGMTVELPPTLSVRLTSPYQPPELPACDKISVQATPWMSEGFFDDKTVDPKQTYWYRVVGIDYDGNETPLEQSVPVSTFTFTRKKPAAPTLDNLFVQENPCAVKMEWSTPFDPQQHIGFIIYRSDTDTGPFIPIVKNPVTTNVFVDNQVVRENTYWYRLGILMRNGQLSALSDPKSIMPK